MSPPAVDLTLDLPLPAGARAVGARVIEGISRLTHAAVEIATPEHVAFHDLLRSDVTLGITLDGATARSFKLRLGGARFLGVEGDGLRYELDLHPRLWFLGHTLSTRKFRGLSARDIVSLVLAEGGVPFEWHVTAVPPVSRYRVQYRETNLAFVSRLLEREGIYHTFSDADVLLLGDRSASADFVEGERHHELLDAAGALDRGERGIHAWRTTAEVAPGRATVNDFNWKKPALDLLSGAAAGEDADLEIYDYPTGFRDPGRGAFLARIRLEAERVRARFVEGRSSVPSFAPLRRLTFGDRGGAPFAGEHLLVEVEHTVRAAPRDPGAPGGERRTYENRFRAIPGHVPFRPAWRTPRPTVQGFHTATVTGPSGAEIHTDRHGRFRARFHWDREATGTDVDSRWIRLVQESSTSMALARVGWEMNVAYIDGDPDRPIGAGRHINGVMPPAYAQPAHRSVMTIRTPTSPRNGGHHELRLEDREGEQQFFLRAERDFVGLVGRDRRERIGHDEIQTIHSSRTLGVEGNQTVTIGAASTTTCGGSLRLIVRGDRSISVGGSETIDVGLTSQVAVLGDDSETTLGPHVTLAGLGGSGAVRRRAEGDLSRSVGGAFVTVAGGSTRTLIQKNASEAIAGPELVVATAGSVVTETSGTRTLRVLGSVLRTSGKDMGISAEQGHVDVAGPVTLLSAERVELRGASVVLSAQAGLRLAAPGLSIELSPGSVALRGDVRLDAGEKVTTTGGPDNITG